METRLKTIEIQAHLATFRKSVSREEAVHLYLDIQNTHKEHIIDVKRRVEQVYRFETPDRPVFQFDVKGFIYEKSDWVRTDDDHVLDRGLQNIVYKMESMPDSDFVPLLPTGFDRSDLIPRMFGVTFDYPDDGSVLQHFNLIEKLPGDLGKLSSVDVTQSDVWREVVERVSFLVEATQERVHIAYPQMQGPLTNAARLMEHSEMLMACLTDPDSMRIIANTWSDTASRLIRTLQKDVGDPTLLRPRTRFFQPSQVKGLIVGDYLCIMDPEQYYDICVESWEILYRTLGPIFYHTCGPVIQTLDVLKRLPGLAGFECTYIREQSGKTSDIARVKAGLDGKIVLHHFVWPLGGAVEDRENLTTEWLRMMGEGGGFMMHDSGTAEEGRELFEKLGLA